MRHILKKNSFKILLNKDYFNLLYFILIWFGIFLRIWDFNTIPSPLNQDEVASGYEAWSLITTAKDRWGNFLPMYFVSWGSGQNVLYSYIVSIFFGIFGVSDFVLRLPNLLFGIASIFFSYKLFLKIFNNSAPAKIVSVLIALNPWLVLTNRWTMDPNFVPFLVILGLYTLVITLSTNKNNLFKISLALLPFGFLFYGYATSLFVVPIFLFLFLIFYLPKILYRFKGFLLAFITFCILIFPFATFIFKNNIVKKDLAIEKYLPITIPLLPSSRVELTPENIIKAQISNIDFIERGFQDYLIWNSPKNLNPHSYLVIVFFYLGSIYLLIFFVLEVFKKFQFVFNNQLKNIFKNIFKQEIIEQNEYRNLLFLWLVSCVPMFFLFEQNLNRSNLFQIILILISSFGIWQTYLFIKKFKYNIIFYKIHLNFSKVFILIISLVIIYNSVVFGKYLLYPTIDGKSEYFIDQKSAFNYGFKETILKIKKNVYPEEKVLVTNNVAFNYLFVSFYAEIKPEVFHKSNWKQIGGGFEVNNIDRYYFDYKEKDFATEKTFLVITRNDDFLECNNSQILFEKDEFKLLRCFGLK